MSRKNGNDYAMAMRRNAGRRIDEAMHDMHRTPPVQAGSQNRHPRATRRHPATFSDAEIDAMLREASLHSGADAPRPPRSPFYSAPTGTR